MSARRQSQAITDRAELASAYWLCYTTVSHMVNNAVDLRHVRDNLGHESIGATSHYPHADDDERLKPSYRLRMAFTASSGITQLTIIA